LELGGKFCSNVNWLTKTVNLVTPDPTIVVCKCLVTDDSAKD
jgi:hypothetical protein